MFGRIQGMVMEFLFHSTKLVRSQFGWEEIKTFFIRGSLVKTLRGSLKVKTQRGQYLLAVGLSCYK